MDDFKDILLTASESGKTAARDGGGHRPNLPAAIGMDAARARLASLLDEARSLVAGLQSHGTAWSILEGLQHVLDRERIRLQTRLAVAA